MLVILSWYYLFRVTQERILPFYTCININALRREKKLFSGLEPCKAQTNLFRYTDKCWNLVSIVRTYHNHKLQTNPWHREEEHPWHCEEEPHNNHETPARETKQRQRKSNQLSLPHQDNCKTRMDTKWRTTKHKQLQNPKMGVTINNESTTTEPLP